MMSTPTLPQALRARRAEIAKSRGLDDFGQEAASLEMGLHKNQCHRWETGTIPRPESVPVLMEFLGITQDELGAVILETQMERARRASW